MYYRAVSSGLQEALLKEIEAVWGGPIPPKDDPAYADMIRLLRERRPDLLEALYALEEVPQEQEAQMRAREGSRRIQQALFMEEDEERRPFLSKEKTHNLFLIGVALAVFLVVGLFLYGIFRPRGGAGEAQAPAAPPLAVSPSPSPQLEPPPSSVELEPPPSFEPALPAAARVEEGVPDLQPPSLPQLPSMEVPPPSLPSPQLVLPPPPQPFSSSGPGGGGEAQRPVPLVVGGSGEEASFGPLVAVREGVPSGFAASQGVPTAFVLLKEGEPARLAKSEEEPQREEGAFRSQTEAAALSEMRAALAQVGSVSSNKSQGAESPFIPVRVLVSPVFTDEVREAPLVVQAGDGRVFLGRFVLQPPFGVFGEVDTVVVGGQSRAATGRVFGRNGQLAPVTVEDVAYSLAQDLLRAAVGGVTRYVQGLEAETRVVLQGDRVVAERKAPGLLEQVLGSAASVFQMPPGRSSFVRVYRLQDEELRLLLLP
ncbi:MAG: hypothetical protein QXD60_01460 [Nanopusillaceae archaeon]